jgi:hypothetical protein
MRDAAFGIGLRTGNDYPVARGGDWTGSIFLQLHALADRCRTSRKPGSKPSLGDRLLQFRVAKRLRKIGALQPFLNYVLSSTLMRLV